jgi:hypothetical protein
MFVIAVNIKLHCPESVDPDLGSIADSDSGSGAFLTYGSGMGKKSKSESGIRIRDKYF